MNITWTSRRGRQRRSNSDAAAIAYAGQHLVIVVVDAAEKVINGRLIAGINDKGKRLAQYWADSCLCGLIATAAYKSEAEIVAHLHEKQKQLRVHYLHDIASYAVLVMDTGTLEFDGWFTGDCRIGTQSTQGAIEWLTAPHRVQRLPFLDIASYDDFLPATGHILTQSLNARRFVYPEKLTSKAPENGSLVIATDGYWCEHLLRKVDLQALEDDASLLTIKPGKQKLCLQTDTPNLLVKYS